ncbi:hypothetical protein [Streptomyces sioyaensis]|uniref:MmyB family transcriptional regulator n=1 Tax=Streptomyces sioyaensis TaxID=67364 RepID=UPI0037A079D6
MWKDAIDGIAHMAYVTDQSYNLLAYNAAFSGLFPHTAPPRNMLDWMLLSAEGRHALTDWETAWAPYVLPQLRAARAALPHDAVLARIECDVMADPECGRLYNERVTAQVHPDGQERPLLHPTLGPSWVQICAAEPLSSPNARMMIVMVYPAASHSDVRRPYLRVLWQLRWCKRLRLHHHHRPHRCLSCLAQRRGKPRHTGAGALGSGFWHPWTATDRDTPRPVLRFPSLAVPYLGPSRVRRARAGRPPPR